MSQVLQRPEPDSAASLALVRRRWYRRPGVIAALTVALVVAVVGAVFLAVRPDSSTTPPATTLPTVPVSPSAPITTPTPPPATTPGSGSTVVSSRLAYPWNWPNGREIGTVTHSYPVPPMPKLVAISTGDHPNDPNEPPYNRMAFTFTTAFPSYDFSYVDELLANASGQPIPIDGYGVLKVTFRQAQAHTDDGTASTITSQPARHFGYARMVDYAQAGDYEGVLTYGIGITWPLRESNAQIPVRVYEVERVTAQGQHLYVVAIDVDAQQPAGLAGIGVYPSTARSGQTVVISGFVPISGERPCPRDGLILTSAAAMFPPDGFGPYPPRSATGDFRISYRIPTSTPPGTYGIGLRCGGGNVGVATNLQVTSR